MPLDWDELAGDLDPARFDLDTAPRRLAEVGDFFRPVLTDGQDIGPAIEAFQEHYAGSGVSDPAALLPSPRATG